MFFWNSLVFLWSNGCLQFVSGSSAFVKSSLNIWTFSVHVLLKPSLENVEHSFASVWDGCHRAVDWMFFGIAFLYDCNGNWPFPVLWSLLSFPCFLAYWVQHFHRIGFIFFFWIWNSSTGILSPPLALFIVMLPQVHVTLHFRISGSRWVITLSWLSFFNSLYKIFFV